MGMEDFLTILLGGVQGAGTSMSEGLADKKKYDRDLQLTRDKAVIEAQANEAARKQKLKDNATLLLLGKGLTDRSYKDNSLDFGSDLTGLDLGDPALENIFRFTLRNRPKKSSSGSGGSRSAPPLFGHPKSDSTKPKISL